MAAAGAGHKLAAAFTQTVQPLSRQGIQTCKCLTTHMHWLCVAIAHALTWPLEARPAHSCLAGQAAGAAAQDEN